MTMRLAKSPSPRESPAGTTPVGAVLWGSGTGRARYLG